MGYRVEVDLLGSKKIPSDAYYGIHTLRAVENFNISKKTVNEVPNFIYGMVMIKKAAAQANAELGALDKEKAKYIIKACDLILKENKAINQFPIDLFQGGAGTSLNMNTNEVIANIALELMGKKKGEYEFLDPNDDVNACQSTNDTYPSGLKLGLIKSLLPLISELEKLEKSLNAKGEEFKDIIKMGRTQLQDAVPMTLGQEFQAFADLLADEGHNLKIAKQKLGVLNMGATAIGTGLNTPKGYSDLVVKKLEKITSFELNNDTNLIKATSDTSSMVDLHSNLKRIAIKLSKICNDLRLLSSGPRAGLKEINLPELQAGSSIMPAKVNPVIPEVVNQVCFKVFGNDIALTMASQAAQLQLNVMEPVMAQSAFESLELLANALNTLRTKCVDGISANAETCLNFVTNSIGIITYLNPYIGHANGDKVGKICAETNRNVKEVALELGLLSEEQIDQVLSIENLKHPQILKLK